MCHPCLQTCSPLDLTLTPTAEIPVPIRPVVLLSSLLIIKQLGKWAYEGIEKQNYTINKGFLLPFIRTDIVQLVANLLGIAVTSTIGLRLSLGCDTILRIPKIACACSYLAAPIKSWYPASAFYRRSCCVIPSFMIGSAVTLIFLIYAQQRTKDIGLSSPANRSVQNAGRRPPTLRPATMRCHRRAVPRRKRR